MSTKRSERGSAMIVALVVILALTSLGLVGLRQAVDELRVTRNRQLNVQSVAVAEYGLGATVFRLSETGQSYDNYFKTLQQASAQYAAGGSAPFRPVLRIRSSDVGVGPAALSSRGNPSPAMFAGGTGCSLTPTWSQEGCVGFEWEQGFRSAADNAPSFVSELSGPVTWPAPPGTSQGFCYRYYTVDTWGWVGDPDQPVADVLSGAAAQMAVSHARADVVLSVADCD